MSSWVYDVCLNLLYILNTFMYQTWNHFLLCRILFFLNKYQMVEEKLKKLFAGNET